MSRRLVMLVAVLAVAALAAAAAQGAARRTRGWAAPQIATVVSHGLMDATSVGTFHPNRPLTKSTLADLADGLKEQLDPAPAAAGTGSTSTDPTPTDPGTTDTTPIGTTGADTGPGTADPGTGGTDTGTTDTTPTTTAAGPDPEAPATMTLLDRSLVAMLGLSKAASKFVRGAQAAGVSVPRRFGTEAVARLLGLRLNHPASQDYLELRPQDTASRAEAAYSAAQILGFGLFADSWQLGWVRSVAKSFSLPDLNDWQRQILTVAFSKIGMPYVWGGTSDGRETDFGVTARGGYDCSGFVWRVYKLQSYPDEGDLASTIEGRTTYTMSVEVPRSERIPFKQLQPADVIFFGSHGRRSSGSEIDHTAIYVGNGWFIQSSGQGVALAQLTGWYLKQFAWGRRPLREAGLEQ